jgi:protocatechuate 3,4-dioxygenase beta subunit
VPGALLEFWQADAAGVYDNEGFTLRGHQFSDEEGRWALETVVPGLYPGRTRHIHVRAQAPAGLLLTTQLYFPDESANAADGIFDPALLVEWEETPSGESLRARFDFVVEGAA